MLLYLSPVATDVIFVVICLFSLVMGWQSSLASDTEPDNYSVECSLVARAFVAHSARRLCKSNCRANMATQNSTLTEQMKWQWKHTWLTDGRGLSLTCLACWLQGSWGKIMTAKGSASYSVCTLRLLFTVLNIGPLLHHARCPEVRPKQRPKHAGCKGYFCDVI